MGWLMDQMSFYSRVLSERRAEEIERIRLGLRADCEARRFMGNGHGPIKESDGWIKRKIGIPICNYISYWAR